ncbi:tetratricopeptide repeat protein [Spirosoma radiotolerans]|uniref:Uncharacterized protein n=1 Tax=Spirosoma radiotolerans TaxID=1379870 RepID=A0A0E3ZV53_9BACT|nr:hypothetical protein [Spirosoma radiotolerans]AKD54840.1 hypothetical protein SD10_07890 [Spirosoma radiotolerans]
MSLFSILFSRTKPVTQGVAAPLSPLVEFHLTQAHNLFKLADYQTAMVHCNEVLALDPAQTKAYQLRGVIRYELQDFVGAGEDLRFSLSLA